MSPVDHRGDEACQKETMLCRVPAFRPVVVKLLRVLGDEDASMSEVSSLLASDPGLSAEVLAEANSALYGGPRRISSTSRAIVMLGTERTKTLAMRASLDAMLRSIGNHPAIENCWLHSRATAAAGQWLAPFFRIHPERAYTAGLMHDVGRLGLLSLDTRGYAKVLDTTGPTDRDVMEAERWLFKMDHCEAGAWLTRAWGFPDELQTAASQHHTGRRESRDAGVNLARLACSLAQAMGYKAAALVYAPQVPEVLEELPEIVRQGMDEALASLAERLEKEVGASPVRAG